MIERDRYGESPANKSLADRILAHHHNALTEYFHEIGINPRELMNDISQVLEKVPPQVCQMFLLLDDTARNARELAITLREIHSGHIQIIPDNMVAPTRWSICSPGRLDPIVRTRKTSKKNRVVIPPLLAALGSVAQHAEVGDYDGHWYVIVHDEGQRPGLSDQATELSAQS